MSTDDDQRPAVPWPTEFEIEVRRDLAEVVAHQRRSDALVMQLQLEQRASAAATATKLEAIDTKLAALLAELRGNGHG